MARKKGVKNKPKEVLIESAPKAWTITLQANDQVLKGKGSTCLEALQNLPRPTKIVGKATLTVEGEGRGKVEGFLPDRLKRLFYNKNYLIIQAKNLQIGMK